MNKTISFSIQDWAGNSMNYGTFTTFEDAEAYLSARLGDDYDTDRQEYEIVEHMDTGGKIRHGQRRLKAQV